MAAEEHLRALGFTQHEAACCDVSFAGSFAAFKSGDSVDVVDLRKRRLAYRAGAPRGESIAAFDVQSDGKLAVLLGPAQDGRFAIAWRAPGVSILQPAKLRAVLPPSGPAVRLVADRLIAERRIGSSTELIVADLHGRTRVLARFVAPIEQVGGFDAGELRVTWASRRITSTRVDCPPPGQGRPCRRLKSGVETVWASFASGAPRPVARWSFADSP